jgi:hypothetical protein
VLKNYLSYCITMNPAIFHRVNLVMIVAQMRVHCQVVNKQNMLIMKTIQMTTVTCNMILGQGQGTETPCFPFSGKPGINIDLEAWNKPLVYFKLFITPKTATLTSRETNQYAQQFLENKSDLKLKPKSPPLEWHKQRWSNDITGIFSVTRASSKIC